MRHRILNFSDLIDGHWSPTSVINKAKGKLPYIKQGGIYIEVGKSIPKNTVYLFPEQVKKYNEIAQEILRLQEEQKKII